MAAVAPEPGALELQTLAEATPRDATPSAVAVEVPTLVANRVTIQKPAADAKLGVALRKALGDKLLSLLLGVGHVAPGGHHRLPLVYC